jgi:hypothetical protein
MLAHRVPAILLHTKPLLFPIELAVLVHFSLYYFFHPATFFFLPAVFGCLLWSVGYSPGKAYHPFATVSLKCAIVYYP